MPPVLGSLSLTRGKRGRSAAFLKAEEGEGCRVRSIVPRRIPPEVDIPPGAPTNLPHPHPLIRCRRVTSLRMPKPFFVE